jgi:uncharacterized membrane protein HdeD (DUF308 family)
MQEMSRAETLWLRIIGVLLILLGLTLFVSPSIKYRTREKIIHTDSIDVTAKREKTITIPRVSGVLVITAGVMALIFASRKPQE